MYVIQKAVTTKRGQSFQRIPGLVYDTKKSANAGLRRLASFVKRHNATLRVGRA